MADPRVARSHAPVGLAPVDFFRFPVVIRPWGRTETVPLALLLLKLPGAAPRELSPRDGIREMADRIVEPHDPSR